ncbi:MAG: glycosyltransferase family 2 protein, partial [Bdellovibrionales bacterium]|nr:glycosyltransferase family 2 protein [Bdellovibrionales bacterium]
METCFHIAVAISTYRREAGLDRLMKGLAKVVEPQDCKVSVVIVDNDPECSSRNWVQKLSRSFPYPIFWQQEPKPGISQARNRSVLKALEIKASHIAFIDDDETPSTQWLVALMNDMKLSCADVVWGRVIPLFQQPPSLWVRKSRYFEHPKKMHFNRAEEASTHNCLVKAQLFQEIGPFDEFFGLRGGEDTDFFRRVFRS